MLSFLTTPWHFILTATPGIALASALCATFVCVVAVVGHELAHWSAARAFGVKGRIGFFTRRGSSRLWFLSVMGVRFEDRDFAALTRWQARVVAAGGPAWDLAFSIFCLSIWQQLVGPEWVSGTFAVSGLIYFAVCWVNIVPLPFRNDGWLVLWPEAIFDKAGNDQFAGAGQRL
ncbi:site-2 protease family protein [Burkholderia sp. Ac-20365]|uniref:site-2 protease family protein n=1 Tax=Burkholderia sp. Ac-20365 TaxID=2703897 RepID=UPI00197B1EA8|nr:site-2 protease family protein [Burkholderia sp. Ac-20365]MBN3761380.1 site-2 protease family protein [Burkholderia sp. Ac-20365]